MATQFGTSKRGKLRSVLSGSGLTALRWKTLGRGLYCFNYHRIGDPATCAFSRGVYSCSADRFREHMLLLKERFDVVNIARLLEFNRDRQPARPLALVTFDDGYADNYEVAFPILKEVGIPAVFFIPTAYIDGSRLLWWDEIAWCLRHATVERVRLNGVEGDFSLGSDDVERSINRIQRLIQSRADVSIDDQLMEVRECCRPSESSAAAARGLFASREQIREMRRGGMDVGAHTHSHPVLSHLTDDSQREELRESKAILEELLGEPVPSVAYPFGSSSDYNRHTCRIAESLGYQIGFNFINRINRMPLTNPLDVFRLHVSGDPAVDELKARICFPWL